MREMNLLDRAISIVAPRVALQRAHSRVALELPQSYLERHAQRFRYDGATAGRRAHGWYAASTDANVELMGSLIWLSNPSSGTKFSLWFESLPANASRAIDKHGASSLLVLSRAVRALSVSS